MSDTFAYWIGVVLGLHHQPTKIKRKPYVAKRRGNRIEQDESLVRITQGLASEVYKAERLLLALAGCASSEEVRATLESELAL